MSVTTWHPKQEMCRNPEFEELLREKSEACKKSLEAEKDELKRWALLCRIKVMELLMDRENVTFDMAKEECEVFEEHGLTAEAKLHFRHDVWDVIAGYNRDGGTTAVDQLQLDVPKQAEKPKSFFARLFGRNSV